MTNVGEDVRWMPRSCGGGVGLCWPTVRMLAGCRSRVTRKQVMAMDRRFARGQLDCWSKAGSWTAKCCVALLGKSVVEEEMMELWGKRAVFFVSSFLVNPCRSSLLI